MEIVKNTSAEESIEKLQKIINFIGSPKVLVSDNGTPFTSWRFTNWCRVQGIDLVHTSPFQPQSNGSDKI